MMSQSDSNASVATKGAFGTKMVESHKTIEVGGISPCLNHDLPQFCENKDITLVCNSDLKKFRPRVEYS